MSAGFFTEGVEKVKLESVRSSIYCGTSVDFCMVLVWKFYSCGIVSSRDIAGVVKATRVPKLGFEVSEQRIWHFWGR